MRKISIIPICMALLLLLSCGGGETAGPKEIRRLDRALISGDPVTDSVMRGGAALLFRISGYGEFDDSSAIRYAAMPSISIHTRAVDSAFADLGALEVNLGEMLGRAATLLPDVKVGDVFAIISPFNQSVLVSDSTLFIGLNHYLGTSYAPYAYFPDYIRSRKIPSRIIPDVAEALVRGAYPFQYGGRTVGRLFYEGAVAEAVMQLTGEDEAAVLGYIPEQMQWLEDNESDMWNALIERRILFSGNPDDSRALVFPGPVTSSLHPEAPGAAGRFVGHRLLRSYLDKHSRLPLDTLLSPEFYNSEDALSNSRYTP